MDLPLQPHRCPKCGALVVDRRSPVCTTCREALPKEWIMTPEQSTKVRALDAQARAQHLQEIRKLDPQCDPNVPALVKLLDSNASVTGLL
jgi:predicted  nucleic acid-binding Zn-ribbon protein